MDWTGQSPPSRSMGLALVSSFNLVLIQSNTPPFFLSFVAPLFRSILGLAIGVFRAIGRRDQTGVSEQLDWGTANEALSGDPQVFSLE